MGALKSDVDTCDNALISGLCNVHAKKALATHKKIVGAVVFVCTQCYGTLSLIHCLDHFARGVSYTYGQLFSFAKGDGLAVPYGSLRYPTVPYGTLRYPTVPYGSLRYPTVPYGTLRFPTVPYGTLRYPTVPYGSLII